MKLLGVDWGSKRIGLAVTDDDIGLPSPLPKIDALGSVKRDAAQLAEIAQKQEVDAVVLGLPLEPDGNEGRMARICRQLGLELERHGLTVRFVDESMTSLASEGVMIEAGIKASVRKKQLDSQAAAMILERYLNEAKAS